jgi:Mrp family chromosome partitioning ATPase
MRIRRRTRGQRSHGLVRTYVWLMLVCAALAVVPAAMLTMSKTVYEAYAQVVVNPTVTQSGSILGAAMPTEQEVAESGYVTRRAAAQLGLRPQDAEENIEVTVPVDANVLNFTYTADTANEAWRGARAFSETYVTYRNSGEQRPIAGLITPASLPEDPVTPDYALVLGVALIGGLALGFGAAYAWDHLSGRLRGAEDAGTRTGLPVLASLPHLSRQRARSSLGADPEMSTAFSQLASRIPGLVESRKEFTLLVTGATAHAGTSTVARQTAVALARMGKRVVLVSTDPSSAAIEESFGVPRLPGLSDLVAGRAVPEQALHDTAVSGLRVLPPGSSPNGERGSSHPQSLDDLQLLIWTLAADSIVIIDAPAVLSSASAAMLGYVADRILLVVDVAHGSRSSAREAVASLGHVADKVVGCVTNQPARVRSKRPSPRAAAAKRSSGVAAPAR